MNQEHILSLVSDYTLDLLSSTERQQVEDHAAACDACRRAIQREKQLALTIGHTLHLAAQPGMGRLQALMPSPPRPAKRQQRATISQPRSHVPSWTTQLAPVTLVLALLVGSLWVYLNGPSDPWRNPAPGYIVVTDVATEVATEMAATATTTVIATSSATASPTSSPVATLAEGGETTLVQTAESTTTGSGRPETAATPIAQVVLGKGTN